MSSSSLSRPITTGSIDTATSVSISTLSGTFSTIAGLPTSAPAGSSTAITQFPSANPGCAMVETYANIGSMTSCCTNALVISYNPYGQGPFVYCNAIGQSLEQLGDCLVRERNLTVDGQVLCNNGTTSAISTSNGASMSASSRTTQTSSAAPSVTSSAASPSRSGLGGGVAGWANVATGSMLMILVISSIASVLTY